MSDATSFGPPAEAAGLLERGGACAARGAADEALALFTEAIRLDPASAVAYAERGRTWARFKGEPEQAVTDFTAALAIDPGYAKAYYQRHLAYVMQGENTNAAADYLAHERLCHNRGDRPEVEDDSAE
jgi:tetratricopeptide (TPR) repeat protein